MNNELLTVRQIDHPMPLTEEQLEEMRTAIRERLEKTNKGGTANSIANCQLILRYDPVFKGKIRRNELTGCTDIVGGMPWRREGTLSSYKEDMTKDVNNQLLTMVSIFTALAFLVFGGISSLDNIFSVHGVPLLKLMCVGAVWGLCILNLIFVFLFCVGKMTKLNFRSSDDPEATIFQKYPVIWWTDLMLMSILLLCLWGYYIQQYEISDWLICICLANQKSATLAGFGVIALIILGACFWLAKRTSVRNK